MSGHARSVAGNLEVSLADLKRGVPNKHGFPRSIIWKDQTIGRLRPLTYADVADEHLIKRLADWRNQERTSFFTQFEATPDSTRNWARSMILDRKDRILFLVEDEFGKTIGQCGVCNLSPQEAELDAILRGERSGSPALMMSAERALFGWLLNEIGVGRLYTRIFAHNITSMRLFLGLGMNVVRWETFRDVRNGNVVRFEPTGSFVEGKGVKVGHLELINSRGAAARS